MLYAALLGTMHQSSKRIVHKFWMMIKFMSWSYNGIIFFSRQPFTQYGILFISLLNAISNNYLFRLPSCSRLSSRFVPETDFFFYTVAMRQVAYHDLLYLFFPAIKCICKERAFPENLIKLCSINIWEMDILFGMWLAVLPPQPSPCTAVYRIQSFCCVLKLQDTMMWSV